MAPPDTINLSCPACRNTWTPECVEGRSEAACPKCGTTAVVANRSRAHQLAPLTQPIFNASPVQPLCEPDEPTQPFAVKIITDKRQDTETRPALDATTSPWTASLRRGLALLNPICQIGSIRDRAEARRIAIASSVGILLLLLTQKALCALHGKPGIRLIRFEENTLLWLSILVVGVGAVLYRALKSLLSSHVADYSEAHRLSGDVRVRLAAVTTRLFSLLAIIFAYSFLHGKIHGSYLKLISHPSTPKTAYCLALVCLFFAGVNALFMLGKVLLSSIPGRDDPFCKTYTFARRFMRGFLALCAGGFGGALSVLVTLMLKEMCKPSRHADITMPWWWIPFTLGGVSVFFLSLGLLKPGHLKTWFGALAGGSVCGSLGFAAGLASQRLLFFLSSLFISRHPYWKLSLPWCGSLVLFGVVLGIIYGSCWGLTGSFVLRDFWRSLCTLIAGPDALLPGEARRILLSTPFTSADEQALENPMYAEDLLDKETASELLSLHNIASDTEEGVAVGRLVLLEEGVMYLAYAHVSTERNDEGTWVLPYVFGIIVGAILLIRKEKAENELALEKAKSQAAAIRARVADVPLEKQCRQFQGSLRLSAHDIVDIRVNDTPISAWRSNMTPSSLEVTALTNGTAITMTFALKPSPSQQETEALMHWGAACLSKNQRLGQTLAPLVRGALRAIAGAESGSGSALGDAIEAWCTTKERTALLAQAITMNGRLPAVRTVVGFLSPNDCMPASRAIPLRKAMFNMIWRDTLDPLGDSLFRVCIAAILLVIWLCIKVYLSRHSGEDHIEALIIMYLAGLCGLFLLSRNLPDVVRKYSQKSVLKKVGARFGFLSEKGLAHDKGPC